MASSVRVEGTDEVVEIQTYDPTTRRASLVLSNGRVIHREEVEAGKVYAGIAAWAVNAAKAAGRPGGHSPIADAALAALLGAAGDVPDSRSLSNRERRESGKGQERGPVMIHGRPEPEPRRYLLEGLVPEGAVTTIYGDGGQGKSYIVACIALHIALGRPFLGLPVERANVLYLDAELDVDEFTSRCYRLARGMGLEEPPEGLGYYELPGSLADPAVREMALAAAERMGAEVIVLDSLSVASQGADMTDAGDVTSILQALRDWRKTVVAIDHIPKPAPGASLFGYRAFGSVFKGNLSRSALQLVRAEGGGVVLRQTKTNFGPLAAPLHLGLNFDGDRVSLRRLEVTDAALAGIEQHLSAPERVLFGLAEYVKGTTPEVLAKSLDMAEKTVRNHLTTLKKQGRVKDHGDGRWEVPDSRSGTGNGNAGGEEDDGMLRDDEL